MTASVAADSLEQAIARALSRAAAYRLLSRALTPPTPLRVAEVGREAAAAAARAELDPETRPRLHALARAAADTDPQALAEEHVFLFDRQVRCSPCEGAYGDGPQLAGKAAALADVSGFYAAFGLSAQDGPSEAEDHIVTELEFMSALALKEAWALAGGAAEGHEVTVRAQAAFLRDHLGCWAAAFADELAAATPLPYYTAVADALRIWVATEMRELGVAARSVQRVTASDALQADSFTCPMAEPEAAS
jgi:TorA maturation chaperone TorD